MLRRDVHATTLDRQAGDLTFDVPRPTKQRTIHLAARVSIEA
jgi:hypothetical protein